MKKNISITFLIPLVAIIPSFTSAEEVKGDIEVNTGVMLQADAPAPRAMLMAEPAAAPASADMKARAEVRQEFKAQRVEVRQAKKTELFASSSEIKKMREENKAEISKIRADFKAELKDKNSSTTEVVKEKRRALIEGIQEKRDLFKKELDARRDAIASTSISIKAKFKADLAKIKDERKKEKAENVGNNLIELNAKIVANTSEKVNKIEEVLITIETRADKAAANGSDVASVRALITTAETAVAEARVAISVQTGKTYTITVTEEAAVKASLQATRDALKADVDTMNAKIKAAHDATRKAAVTLKEVPKVNATTTVQVSN